MELQYWLFLTTPGLNLYDGFLIRSWAYWKGNRLKFMNFWLKSDIKLRGSSLFVFCDVYYIPYT